MKGIDQDFFFSSVEGCSTKPEFIVTNIRELGISNLMMQCKVILNAFTALYNLHQASRKLSVGGGGGVGC